jgi:hypothetical protein
LKKKSRSTPRGTKLQNLQQPAHEDDATLVLLDAPDAYPRCLSRGAMRSWTSSSDLARGVTNEDEHADGHTMPW